MALVGGGRSIGPVFSDHHFLGIPMSEDEQPGDAIEQQRRRMALLWTQAQPAVRGYVAMVVRDRHAVEDVVQDVAVAIARDFETYDPVKPFKPWALGVARHRVLQYLDRNKRDRLVFDNEVLASLAQRAEALSSRQIEHEEALEHCIAQLPAKMREIIVMKYLRDLRVREIADLKQQTLGTITGVLRRARSVLTLCLKQRLSKQGGAG